MEKWKYHMVYWENQTPDELVAELDRLGRSGWELVSTIPPVDGSGVTIFVLKRRDQ
jgi:hypothetical protein